jgi:hypothetical protein
MVLVLVLLSPHVWAQQNLVPNPSFEEYSDCPDNLGQIDLAQGWIEIRGSVDYYNSCGTSNWGVPDNYNGHEEAFGGRAYGGLAVWGFGVSNFREFVAVQLTDPLLSGSKYDVSIRLSLADTSRFAVKNFGFVFTQSQPNNDIGILFGLEPQVTNTGGSFLNDTVGWMAIEGSFIASGNEQFLTIGNFDNDSETDTAQVQEDGIQTAYYYIDDVTVVLDTTYHVGIDEVSVGYNKFNLYPNPNSGEFTAIVGMDETDRAEMTVWSITGQQVHTSTLSAGSNALRLNVAQGLYLYRVTVNGELKWTGKVSIGPR